MGSHESCPIQASIQPTMFAKEKLTAALLGAAKAIPTTLSSDTNASMPAEINNPTKLNHEHKNAAKPLKSPNQLKGPQFRSPQMSP